jgi:hypothetical protein
MLLLQLWTLPLAVLSCSMTALLLLLCLPLLLLVDAINCIGRLCEECDGLIE